jgi:hypothetical protein
LSHGLARGPGVGGTDIFSQQRATNRDHPGGGRCALQIPTAAEYPSQRPWLLSLPLGPVAALSGRAFFRKKCLSAFPEAVSDPSDFKGLQPPAGCRGAFNTKTDRKNPGTVLELELAAPSTAFLLRAKIVAEEAVTVTWMHASDFLDLEISRDTAAYVQHGRAHENLSESELRTLWATAFSAWFRSPTAEDSLGYYDLDAELELRGIETPLATIRSELMAATVQLSPSRSALDPASNERLMNFLIANYSETI